MPCRRGSLPRAGRWASQLLTYLHGQHLITQEDQPQGSDVSLARAFSLGLFLAHWVLSEISLFLFLSLGLPHHH